MPLFYCHLRSSGEYVVDREGSEFPDLDSAYAEAISGARCILSGDIRAGRLDLTHCFELLNEAGEHLLTVRFAEAVDQTRAEVPQSSRIGGVG